MRYLNVNESKLQKKLLEKLENSESAALKEWDEN